MNSEEHTAPGSHGRPRRADLATPEQIRNAPFPELVTAPADQLIKILRRIDDPDELRAAHEHELRSCRRSSILDLIERRLIRLGQPLGGPEKPPIPGYEALEPVEIVGRMLRRHREAGLAARIYSWEWYGPRREEIMRAAELIAGPAAARARVAADGPRGAGADLPFAGYEQLRTTPQLIPAMRRRFTQCSIAELQAARSYERQTKCRSIVLRMLERELRRRISEPADAA